MWVCHSTYFSYKDGIIRLHLMAKFVNILLTVLHVNWRVSYQIHPLFHISSYFVLNSASFFWYPGMYVKICLPSNKNEYFVFWLFTIYPVGKMFQLTHHVKVKMLCVYFDLTGRYSGFLYSHENPRKTLKNATY